MIHAGNKANELKVPLLVCGDIHDSKANMRAECVKAMIDSCQTAKKTIVLVANHDRVNERSEAHALEFLRPYVEIIDRPTEVLGYWLMVPYQHDVNVIKDIVKTCPNKFFIMHQGLTTANMGHYVQDKSALTPEDVAGMRIVSGHYHRRQTIDLPDGGKADYVGNPYTLGFGEANDPPKGFQILYSDGSLEFVPTNLRKHVKLEWSVKDGVITSNKPELNQEDIVQVTLTGTQEDVRKVNRSQIAAILGLSNFKLVLDPAEAVASQTDTRQRTTAEVMDALIDSLTETSVERKGRLKSMWKSFV